jgi:hypothetical protein
MVGFLASWWMGIPIGLLVGAAGFIHRDSREMFRVTLWSFLVVVGFTWLFGLGGLLYGYFQTAHIDVADYRGWYIPDDVTDLRRFLCAGYMHNSSYLGGVLAIPVAWIFHVVMRLRMQPHTALEPLWGLSIGREIFLLGFHKRSTSEAQRSGGESGATVVYWSWLVDSFMFLALTGDDLMNLATQPRLGMGNKLLTTRGFWRIHGSVSLHHKFFWTSGKDSNTVPFMNLIVPNFFTGRAG